MDVVPVDKLQLRSLRHPLKDVILADTSWLLHRSYHAYKDFSTNVQGVETGTGDIFGVLRALLMVIRRKPMSAVILCLDSRFPKRAQLAPAGDYKNGRPDSDHIYSKQNEIISTAFLFPNVYISAHQGEEADDVIYTLSQLFGERGLNVWIYANDRDLYQSLTKQNIRMFKKAQKKGMEFDSFGSEACIERFRVSAKKIAFYRSICGGDASDNIKAYPRFPKDLAAKIVTEYEDPEDFLNGDFDASTDARRRWVSRLRTEPEIMMSNYKLMKAWMIRDLQVFRGEGTEKYLKLYGLWGTGKTIKSMLAQADA